MLLLYVLLMEAVAALVQTLLVAQVVQAAREVLTLQLFLPQHIKVALLLLPLGLHGLALQVAAEVVVDTVLVEQVKNPQQDLE
jgi:hypothetical protein